MRTQGRAQVDEAALFRMVEQMRAITDAAAASTRKARRNATRRATVPARPAAALPDPPADPPATADAGAEEAADPFDVIEQW